MKTGLLARAEALRKKPQEIYFFLIEIVTSLLEGTMLKTEVLVFSHLIYSNSLRLAPKSIEGNGYEIQQNSLLYVFVRFFGLDRAQNTVVD